MMSLSTSRHLEQICLIVTIVMIVITVLFINGEKLGLKRIISDQTADETGLFSQRDYDESWSTATSTIIDLDHLENLKNNDGAYVLDGNLYLTAKGTYVLQGSLENQQVIVAADKAKVHLVLRGVTLSHASLPALYIASADKVFVTLAADTLNTIAVANLDNEQALTADVDAAFYSRSDLSINGSGALTVTAAGGHGIKSTDDLVVTSGQINVTADKTALLGKDSVRLAGGDYVLRAGEDGIKANRTDDDSHGYVLINGGNISINAGDDGIHAETTLTINDGNINVLSSYEGLEGYYIYLNGGTIDLVASDDGINAGGGNSDTFPFAEPPGDFNRQDFMPPEASAAGSNRRSPRFADFDPESSPAGTSFPQPPAFDQLSADSNFAPPAPPEDGNFAPPTTPNSDTADNQPLALLQINGGHIHLNVEGDGLDSNGDLQIYGGDIIVDGPSSSMNGALDSGTESGGDIVIHGGRVLALGNDSMVETFSANSTQVSFVVNFPQRFSAGEQLTLSDQEGRVVYNYQIQKSGNSLVFSSPDLIQSQTYTINIGAQSQTLTLNDISNSNSQGFGGFGRGPAMNNDIPQQPPRDNKTLSE
ncbi:carbohydrate-binding domain-containing protein [bacterium]|nr:carbohydrate-binding domain-containing protein [bacterium]